MLASVFGALLSERVNAAASVDLVDCMTILYPAGGVMTYGMV